MGFAQGLAAQLARPHGFTGRLLGLAMDVANRTPTRLALDLLAPRDGERILDAGCGTGAALDALRRRAAVELAGIDPSPEMIAAAERRLGSSAFLANATIEDMPFAPMSFDAALLLNVLYFARSPRQMIASLHRRLRPGGRLVVYVTHRETMEHWSFVRAGLHRLFDRDALFTELTAGGFPSELTGVQDVAIAGSVKGLLALATRR